MLVRSLFAVVWLVIAAGFLLPAYQPSIQSPGPLATVGGAPTTDVAAVPCTDCAPAESTAPICPSPCPCGYVLAAVWADHGGSVSMTVQLLIWPLPSGLPSGPQPLPPKRPAI